MESAQVEYLWKAMTLLPRGHETCNILLCHFMSVCRSLDGQGDVQLPIKYTQKSAMCQYCANIWKNGKYSIEILPEKTLKKSIKKIISRYNNNPSCLRKFEVGLAKKYARRKNTLVITCGICSKATKLDLFKPQRKVIPENEPLVEEPQADTKKKKRRSRDRTAGLRIPPDFHVQEKLGKKHEKAAVCNDIIGSGNESPAVSHKSSEKVQRVVDNKRPVSVEEFVVSKKSKKKRKLLADISEPPKTKNHCRPKIMKTPDNSFQRSALNKLVKSNNKGNIFSNTSSSSESPLSKFLSSL